MVGFKGSGDVAIHPKAPTTGRDTRVTQVAKLGHFCSEKMGESAAPLFFGFVASRGYLIHNFI